MEVQPEHAKTLLEGLSSANERDRVYMIADLLFQIESYTLLASMTLTGLLSKHPEAARDLYSTKQMMDDLSAWLKNHHQSLYKHLEPTPITQTFNAPEKVMH
jgi:hypothetical protein